MTLRQLLPRLPLVLDTTGRPHRLSSVQVFDVIARGGIGACLAPELREAV